MAENVYFPHAVDMRNDIRIKVLRRRFGFWEGYGMWNTLLEVIYQTNKPTLDLSDTDTLLEVCEEMQTDEETLERFVECCVKQKLLEASSWINFRHVTSSGIVEQMEYNEARKKAGVKGGKASAEARRRRREAESTTV